MFRSVHNVTKMGWNFRCDTKKCSATNKVFASKSDQTEVFKGEKCFSVKVEHAVCIWSMGRGRTDVSISRRSDTQNYFQCIVAWYALEGSTLALWKTTKESAQKQQYCENFPPTFFPFCSQWSFVLHFIDMFWEDNPIRIKLSCSPG